MLILTICLLDGTQYDFIFDPKYADRNILKTKIQKSHFNQSPFSYAATTTVTTFAHSPQSIQPSNATLTATTHPFTCTNGTSAHYDPISFTARPIRKDCCCRRDWIVKKESLSSAVSYPPTVKQIIYEIIKSDPLRFPSKHDVPLESEYGILETWLDHRAQVTSQQILDPSAQLKLPFLKASEPLSPFFYLVRLQDSLDLYFNSYIRSLYGLTYSKLCVYFLPDWKMKEILHFYLFPKNRLFRRFRSQQQQHQMRWQQKSQLQLVNQPQPQLLDYPSIDGVIEKPFKSKDMRQVEKQRKIIEQERAMVKKEESDERESQFVFFYANLDDKNLLPISMNSLIPPLLSASQTCTMHLMLSPTNPQLIHLGSTIEGYFHSIRYVKRRAFWLTEKEERHLLWISLRGSSLYAFSHDKNISKPAFEITSAHQCDFHVIDGNSFLIYKKDSNLNLFLTTQQLDLSIYPNRYSVKDWIEHCRDCHPQRHIHHIQSIEA